MERPPEEAVVQRLPTLISLAIRNEEMKLQFFLKWRRMAACSAGGGCRGQGPGY